MEVRTERYSGGTISHKNHGHDNEDEDVLLKRHDGDHRHHSNQRWGTVFHVHHKGYPMGLPQGSQIRVT